MRVERRFLRWGLFFVALGAMPLAVQLGWLDRGTVGGAWRLWPIFLIAIGLGILLSRSRVALLAGLLSSVALGLILGGALAGGIEGIGCVGSGSPTAAFPSGSGSFGAQAEVDLTVNCATLTLTTATGSTWAFSGSGDPDQQPTVDSSPASLSVTLGHANFFNLGAARSAWQLQLPTDPGLDLSVDTNAGDGHLDLAGARLSALSLTANAGTVNADLSAAADVGSLDATVNAGNLLVALPSKPMAGSFTVNAGHLGLCLPSGMALRIDSSGALATNNFASRGLVQDGTTWTSPGASTNGSLVVLQVTANAGNVELNPEGGCQ